MYADELKQIIFEPNQDWNVWQKTKHYTIEVSLQLKFLTNFNFCIFRQVFQKEDC